MSERRPRWVPDQRKYQSRPLPQTPETYLTAAIRGRYAVQVIQEEILPQNPRVVRILDVGVGLGDRLLRCPYEPYMISAALEEAGVDYAMDIVDIKKEVIANLRGRQKIGIPYGYYQKDSNYRLVWDAYLRRTGQSIAFAMPDGMNAFLDATGVLCADIPRSFQEKLQNRQIRLIVGDIATANLGDKPIYELISCVNVLYQMSKTAQQLAIYHMSRALLVNGCLVLNDIPEVAIPTQSGARLVCQPVMEFNGGWLSPSKLNDLGLAMGRVVEQTGDSPTFFLKRG